MQNQEYESSTQCAGSYARFAEQSVLKNCWQKALAFCFGTLISIAPAIGQEVTVAGFSFAGDFKSAQSRFPYTYKLFSQAKSLGKPNFSTLINERVRTAKNEHLQIKTAENLVSLKKSDRALMTTLVLTDEVVSTENFGAYYKTFVNLRGSALVFDYKNQLIVASYPISVVLFDATPEKPSERRIAEFVDNLIRREDGRGLISQYVRRLETASIPENGSKTLQVKKGSVAPEALAYFPEPLRSNPALVESMLADAFGAVLSSKLKVSMLPTSIGHAIGGVMSMRLENGDGQNTWTFMPSIAYTRLGKDGSEFTTMGMLQFYTKNKDTDYRNAPLLISEALWTARVAKDTNLGVVGGLIYQLGDDKGTTADRLNGFRGHAVGLGPIMNWSGKIGGHPGSFSARAVWDVETKNRPKGYSIGVSLNLLFM